MSLTVYRDGKFMPEEQATVSPFDRGFLYGDGLFETLRCYEGKFFRLDQHVERMRRGLQTLGITAPAPLKEIAPVLQLLAKLNYVANGVARIIVTRGVGEFGLLGKFAEQPMLLAACWPQPPLPNSRYEAGIQVVVAHHRLGETAGLKSLNYLSQILARREAEEARADDAILLNSHGHVAESTASNVFLVRERELITPALEAEILPGITRAAVLELARGDKLPVVERVVHQNDLFHADEVFLTSSVAEVTPVTRLGGHWVHLGQPGPITREMIRAYQALVAREAR